MIFEHVYDIVTDDVFLNLPGILTDSDLFIKIEALNPAGSIKIKTAKGLIEGAEQKNVLKRGDRIIESSSGNLGVALAMICAAKGYQFTCVCDPNASPYAIATIRAYGAEIVEINEKDPNGGYLGSRIEYIERRIAREPGLHWLNQYKNDENPRAHFRATAASILDQFGSVDYLFVGAGTTGTLMGCAQFFSERSPATTIVAVDTLGSVIFGHPPGKRLIPGIGSSRRPEILSEHLIKDVMLVREIDAIEMCRSLAANYGLLVGGSTGSILAAIAQRAQSIPSGSRVIAISPDLGEKYLNSIYSDDWISLNFGEPASIHSAEFANV